VRLQPLGHLSGAYQEANTEATIEDQQRFYGAQGRYRNLDE